MPLDLTLSQLLLTHDSAGPRAVAQSAGATPTLVEAALQTAARYGGPTVAALFVVDLSPGTVAIVRAAVAGVPLLAAGPAAVRPPRRPV